MRVPTADSRIPVTLLTGFLGSGKTTVLNHLLQQTEMRNAAVLINEFGEVGLDHELLETSTKNLVLLQNGCLHRNIHAKLAQALRGLRERRGRSEAVGFDRIVIETTGLADPTPILHILMSDRKLAENFRLDGVITTVDAVTGSATLDRQMESIKQAAVADRLLLTKRDLGAPESAKVLEKRLRALNPSAPILYAENGAVDPCRLLDIGLYRPDSKSSDVQNWLNAEADASIQHHHGHGHDQGADQHDINRHDDHIRFVCLMTDNPIQAKAFDLWPEILTRFKDPDVLRLKAIVHVAGLPAPIALHGVQDLFHPPVPLKSWPRADHRTHISLIVRDLNDEFLQSGFTMLIEAAARNKGLHGKHRAWTKTVVEGVA